nr:MAG TPA: hypothetical protein [Bacteriophage sp.]
MNRFNRRLLIKKPTFFHLLGRLYTIRCCNNAICNRLSYP